MKKIFINILTAITIFIGLFFIGIFTDKFIGLFITKQKDYYDFYKNFKTESFFQKINKDGTVFVTNANDTQSQRPAMFQLKKKSNTIRMIFLGASSVYGAHIDDKKIFTYLLGKKLNTLYNKKKIEIINMAESGVDSELLLFLSDEVLEYKPDIVVIYAGHNDCFHFMYNINKTDTRRRLIDKFAQFIGYQNNIKKLFLQLTQTKNDILNVNIQYSSDDLRLSDFDKFYLFYKQNVLSGFKQNIDAVINKFDENNIQIILMTPVSNISDLPPVNSWHFTKLSLKNLNLFNMFYLKGTSLIRKKIFEDYLLKSALEAFTAAAEIDNTYADLHYNLGVTYSLLKDYSRAYKHFVLARDYDALLARAPSDIGNVLIELGKKHNLTVIDTSDMMLKKVHNKWLGYNVFLDYMHFNEKGHQIMCDILFQKLNNITPQYQ